MLSSLNCSISAAEDLSTPQLGSFSSTTHATQRLSFRHAAATADVPPQTLQHAFVVLATWKPCAMSMGLHDMLFTAMLCLGATTQSVHGAAAAAAMAAAVRRSKCDGAFALREPRCPPDQGFTNTLITLSSKIFVHASLVSAQAQPKPHRTLYGKSAEYVQHNKC